MKLESVHGWNLNAKKSLLSEALMEYFEKIANPDENLDDERKNEDPNVEENDEPEEEVEVDAETTSGGSKKRKKTRSGGFQTLVQLSTKLSEFFDGEIALRRPEVR